MAKTTRKFRLPIPEGASNDLKQNQQRIANEISALWEALEKVTSAQVTTTTTQEITVTSGTTIFTDSPTMTSTFTVTAEPYGRFRFAWGAVDDENLLQYVFYINTVNTKPAKGDTAYIIKRASKGETTTVVTVGTVTEGTGITLAYSTNYYLWMSTIDEDGNESNLTAAASNPYSLTTTVGEFPVGWLLFSVVDTNPSTFLGYGTWSKVGDGKFFVGVDSGDSDWNVAEETGGTKTHIHTAHPDHVVTQPSDHTVTAGIRGASAGNVVTSETHSGTAVDAHSAHSSVNHCPPYYAGYMWKRTA